MVKNRGDGSYWSEEGTWLFDSQRAARFETASQAVKQVSELPISRGQALVVWKSELPGCDWILWGERNGKNGKPN